SKEKFFSVIGLFQKFKSCDEKIKRSCDMFFDTASFSDNSFLFLGVAHFFCNHIFSFLADGKVKPSVFFK
ncbi:hypothetical protein, partial [Enterococcus faecium]|uniref:hypothetical protein n=1 Tax=Enterococcus faecium TaxID=1352 RepID=UPI003CC6D144